MIWNIDTAHEYLDTLINMGTISTRQLLDNYIPLLLVLGDVARLARDYNFVSSLDLQICLEVGHVSCQMVQSEATAYDWNTFTQESSVAVRQHVKAYIVWDDSVIE